jgi:uncharacterized protein (TIGR03437 family)
LIALTLTLLPSLWGASGIVALSQYVGGEGDDEITAMAVDGVGNVYLTGWTNSASFPVTAGAFQTKHAGRPGTLSGLLSGGGPLPDAFVMKLNPAGQIVYATYLGGADVDKGLGIAVDAAGSAYVVGPTASANFPVTTGAPQARGPGTYSTFVAKLSPDGSTLVYSALLGGGSFDSGAIALDSQGNVYVGGTTTAAGLATSAGAWKKQGVGAFAAKLNANGTAVVYATFLGDDGRGSVNALAVDVAGNLYAAGTTSAADFPATPGAVRFTGAGKSAAFVVKLNAAGSDALYSALLGGNDNTTAGGVALDAQGNAYLAGTTLAADFPVTAGALQAKPAGAGDGFVAKLNTAGSSLVFATLLGGTGVDAVSGIAVDTAGNVLVSGTTYSTDFPLTADALQRRFAGSPCVITSTSPFGGNPAVVPCSDAFAAKLNSAGSALLYSTTISGSGRDSGLAVAAGAAGAIYVAGWTDSNNFPVAGAGRDARFPSTCVISNSPSSSQSYPCEDGFVARIDFPEGATPPALRVVNFGSLLETPVAAAEVVTLFGAGIGPDTPATLQLDAANRLTTTLAGTRVLFDGVAAPLIRVEAGQISVIVPNSVAGKARSAVGVERDGRVLASATVVIGKGAPALLTVPTQGVGGGTGSAAAINIDGTLNSAASPAPAGSEVALFAIGLGGYGLPDGGVATSAIGLARAPLVVVGNGVNNSTGQVLYAGTSPTMTAALTQINIRLPAGVTGRVPLWILSDELSSQFGVTIFVK